MEGKIIIENHQKSKLNNNVYEVYIDKVFVGKIDYKQPKLEYITSLGKHDVRVITKDFETEDKIKLSFRQLILPIEIRENDFFFNKDSISFKLFKGIVLGFFLIYTLALIFLLTSNNYEFKLTFFIPYIIIGSLFLNVANEKFTLKIKNKYYS